MTTTKRITTGTARFPGQEHLFDEDTPGPAPTPTPESVATTAMTSATSINTDDYFFVDDPDPPASLPDDIDAKLSPAQQRLQIAQALAVLLVPGQVTELRALDVVTKGYRQPHTLSGYFDKTERLIDGAIEVSGIASGVYFIPAIVNPALIARANNRLLQPPKGSSTGDHDIHRRTRLLLDFDAVRPAGISSTRAQRDAALARAQDVVAWLLARGWPEPVSGASGNGAHEVFNIDLPAKDDGLVERVLKALAQRFSDDVVKVDTAVHNAARIWKLPGTLARKGDDTIERPHRFARLIRIPETYTVVDRELLETVAADVQSSAPSTKPAVAAATSTSKASGPRPTSGPPPLRASNFDIEAFIAQHLPNADGPHPWRDGRKWVLPVCVWNPAHDNAAAFILQRADGAIAAGCRHDGCSTKRWRDLRLQFEPDAYAPRASRPAPLRLFPAASESALDFGDLDDEADTLPIAAELDALWADGLVVPGGYRVTRAGVDKLSLDKQGSRSWSSVLTVPLVVRARSISTHGEVKLQVTWWDRRGSHNRWLDRGDVANPRKLLNAASFGLPIDARIDEDASAYLCDFERANDATLPTVTQTPNLGWLDDDTFMLPEGIVTTGTTTRGKIELAPMEGADQLAAAHHKMGTLEGWIEAIHGLEKYLAALFIFYAAFAAPLLRILGLQSILVDMSSETSKGKTSAKRLAASPWGQPNPEGIIGTWATTPTAIERRLGLLGSLPAFLDDSMRGNPAELSKMIYLVCNGRGGDRGTVTGVQHTTSWQTIAISSGEMPITSFAEHGGARARVLLITEPPFGTAADVGAFVENAVAGVNANYGHAAPLFVKWLLANAAGWPRFRREHEKAAARLTLPGDPGSVRRAAANAAAISIAGRLAHAALPLPWKFTDPLVALWPEMKARVCGGADIAAAALEKVFAWASGHPANFSGDGQRPAGLPPGGLGYVGRWVDRPGYLALRPDALEQLLAEMKYPVAGVLDSWHRRQWTAGDATHRHRMVPFLGRGLRMVAINYAAIVDVCGVDPRQRVSGNCGNDPGAPGPGAP